MHKVRSNHPPSYVNSEATTRLKLLCQNNSLSILICFQESIYFHKIAEQMSARLLAYYSTMAMLLFFQCFQNSHFLEYLWTAASGFGEVVRSLCIASPEWTKILLVFFSCGFGNWDLELEMTDWTLFWQDIKPTMRKVKMLEFPQIKSTHMHDFFKSNTSWNWQKIKQKLSNTLRLNFCYLKIIRIQK